MLKRNQQEAASEPGLEARLRDYSAVTRVSAPARNGRRRFGNWSIYAAATGSALALATSASAGIINTGIVSGSFQSVSVNPAGPTQLGLLMGGPEVNIHAGAGSYSGHATAALSILPVSPVHIIFSGSQLARDFALGAAISGAGSVALGQIVKIGSAGNLLGNFESGQVGFAGFYFVNGANTDYGWIELTFTENAGLPYNLQALAFGVDTNAGQSAGDFAAGQIDGGFIPEPGTMSLALLAAGAAGVEALRRQRQQRAKAGATAA